MSQIDFSPGAIILAAGASSRMGRPKMLLPWRGTSVIGHLIERWGAAGVAQVAVVMAEGDRLIDSELDRLGFPAGDRIMNPEPARGMFSSIQCASRWGGWKADLTHWALVLGDQPQLRGATLKALLDFAALHPRNVCQPAWRGRARHPVVLPRGVFDDLRSSARTTLRLFLRERRAEVVTVEMDDPGLNVDLDFPSDYESARRDFGG